MQHQDAHEMLQCLLNSVVETLKSERTADSPPSESPGIDVLIKEKQSTWIEQLFQGNLSNETQCNICENKTITRENFLDLSIEINPGYSLNHALQQFSSEEHLCGSNKFYCDCCCSLQEAEKRLRVEVAPELLVIHLKRFKIDEYGERFVKLGCRVPFNLDLRFFDPGDIYDVDKRYTLSSFVVHIGSSTDQGHYVSVVKIANEWVLFDDEKSEVVSENELQQFFGGEQCGCGYIFFYQSTA